MTAGSLSGSALGQRLQDHGYRLTAQRRLVLDAVQDLPHATPESILARVRTVEPHVNLSTVYRVLAVLQEVGLVTHSHIGTGSPAYHMADAAPHVHLTCIGCGTVSSVPISVGDRFAADVEEAAQGFKVDVRHAAIYGQCARCAGDAPAET